MLWRPFSFQPLKRVEDASKIIKYRNRHQLSQLHQVGTGGLPGNPRGGTTRLVETNEAGVRRTLAEAAGGFGAVHVDEEAHSGSERFLIS